MKIVSTFQYFIFQFVVFIFLFLCISASLPTAQAEEIRVGVYDNPPKVFVTENGISAGLYPDILNAIAKEKEWKLKYVFGSWDECIERLKKGEIDILVDIAQTEERLENFNFSSETVLTNWGAVYTKKGMKVSSFKDLKNKTIALVKKSAHSQEFVKLMKKFDIPFNAVNVRSYPQALMLLDSSQIDACIINRLYGILFYENYDVETTPLVLSPKTLLFAAKKGDKKSKRILEQIDDSLIRLKNNPDSVYHHAMGYYLSGGKKKWEEIKAGYLKDLKLTPEEQQWVRDNPVVKYSVDGNFLPFESLSKDGKFIGMAADYLNLISRKTGLKFEIVKYDSWPEAIDAARKKEIDLLPCLANTKKRNQFLSFSESYIHFSRVIITSINSPVGRINNILELQGFSVGVQQNSSHHDFIKTQTDITPHLFETFQEAVMALSNGKIDSVIGNLAVASHLIKNLSLTNVKFAGYAASEPQKLSMGVRDDWPELTEILNKALGSITFREKNRILSKWFPLPTEAYNHLGLTREEREWLLINPRIRVAWDRDWAPIEFADENGTPKGISMEYLTAIENILGIEFDMGSDLEWSEVEKLVEKRELDMFSSVAITPKRMKHLEFTDSYLSLPVVIFARDDMPYVRDLSDILDKKIGLVDGYAVSQWFVNDYPGAKADKVSTVKEGFDLLKQKKIDVFLCNVLPGNFYLSRLKSHNIKIVGETPYRLKLRMAVRKDWPLFTRVLQKTLKSLPEAEKTYFYRKWALVKYEKGFDYSLFKKVMATILVVFAVIIFWNRYMAAEISRRKKIEVTLGQREAELREKNKELKKLEELKDNLAHMIVHDMQSPLSSIGTSIDMLQLKSDSENSDAKLSRLMLIARTGVDTLARMMQALLDIFKLESNELPLKPVNTNLKKFAEQTIEQMQSLAQVYNQTLALTGEPVEVCFDVEIIRRVLTNLIDNAFKASSEGSKVEVFIIKTDSGALIRVKDSGHGIPEEFRRKVFDKFSKLESGSKKFIRSYGLGLAFCKLAVEAHNGEIEVESKEGRGSIFSFTLPL